MERELLGDKKPSGRRGIVNESKLSINEKALPTPNKSDPAILVKLTHFALTEHRWQT